MEWTCESENQLMLHVDYGEKSDDVDRAGELSDIPNTVAMPDT